jgi:hypothetical protein
VTRLVSAKIATMSAGDKLRRRIHAALRDAGRDTGAELTFDRLEEWRIARAVELEDRREQLQARLDAELAAGSGAATVTNLSAEVRRCLGTISDLLNAVDFGGPAPAVEGKRWDPLAARRDAAAGRGRGRPGGAVPVA